MHWQRVKTGMIGSVGGQQDRGRQRLYGGGGRDVIRGGAGVDTLVGAGGPDSMVSGGGYDRCAKLGGDSIHSCESVVPHYPFLLGGLAGDD